MLNRRNHAPLLARGMTLIEILVVLVIIGLVIGIAAPNIFGRGEKAKWDTGKATTKRLAMAVDQFALDTGSLPNSLRELVDKPGNVEGWTGPYVTASNLKDPFQGEYQFNVPGSKGEYEVIFLGKDKRPGGDELNRDASNWD